MKPEDWISVKERLPKDGEHIPVSMGDHWCGAIYDPAVGFRGPYNGDVLKPSHWLEVVLPESPDAFEQYWKSSALTELASHKENACKAWHASREALFKADAERAYREWRGYRNPTDGWHAAIAWLRKEAGV